MLITACESRTAGSCTSICNDPIWGLDFLTLCDDIATTL